MQSVTWDRNGIGDIYIPCKCLFWVLIISFLVKSVTCLIVLCEICIIPKPTSCQVFPTRVCVCTEKLVDTKVEFKQIFKQIPCLQLKCLLKPIWQACSHKGRRSSHRRKHQIYGVVYSRHTFHRVQSGCHFFGDWSSNWKILKTIKCYRTAIKWATRAMLFLNKNFFTRLYCYVFVVKDHFRSKRGHMC